MELEPNHSSASSASTQRHATTESRQTRSSARVKATKDETATSGLRISSLRRTRSTVQLDQSDPKGKGKAVADDSTARSNKRTRRATASSLTINEPARDPKGKKRAAPEPDSESEQDPEDSPANKIPKTAYSLRSRKSLNTANKQHTMPKKSSRLVSKGKASAAGAKAKAAAAASSSASRMEDDDIEMMDVEERSDEEELHDHREDDDDEDDDEDDEEEGDPGAVVPGAGGTGPGGSDEGAALALFGDYRSMGSYMITLSNRLKTILNNIKPTADPTTRLVALQELSELLSISTEDTLSGYFQVDAFVKELVKTMGGKGGETAQDEDDDEPQDEDAALAAAIAMSSGGTYTGDDNLEAQVLACRCLANLMEAMPGSAHTVVYHGAVPVLCSKLVEISYIDLAEQTLSTLEKISEEYPSAIVREGGLAALLNYLDFFSTTVQRTALQAASNCCRNASPDSFTMIRDVFPIVRNVLGYSDQRLVEYACLCVIRTIESYHRSSPGLLETLLDTELIRAIHALLLPAGGSPLISSNTYTLFLRALCTAAKASPGITVALLEADVVDILYQILTGVLPPQIDNHMEEGAASGGQGLGGGLADMAVMANLAHRPKEQVEEALSLVSELMPPLAKDGVFDPKAYSEKALARLIKAKAKAERAAQRASAPSSVAQSKAVTPPIPEDAAQTPDAASQSQTTEPAEGMLAKEPAVNRTDLLRSKPQLVARFTRLLVPVLVDVYAASVASHVRTKTLTGLLKAVSFLDGDDLKNALKFVPVASFSGSILSTRDHPTLVISALQLVELLLCKMPSEYKPAFRREGVLHEIEIIADQKLAPKPKEPEPTLLGPSAEGELPPPPAVMLPPTKRSSSHVLDPQDAVTLRGRVVRFKYLSGTVELEDAVFAQLRSLVARITHFDASEETLRQSLREIADLFASPNTSVSSFELLQSGLVDGLLEFATVKERTVEASTRQQLLLETFIERSVAGTISPTSQTPFSILVKKLQESLTRMESFEVVTVSHGIDDSKRHSASMLARQLRLRLVAEEGSDIPRNCSNIIVSIHAIATFQALNDYLRPRVSGLLGSMGGSRLSGMLAALAASGIPAGALARGGAGLGLGSGGESSQATAPAAGSSVSAPAPATEASTATSLGRRRSLRLSAKTASAPLGTAPTTSASAVNPHEAPALDPPLSETAVNEDEDVRDEFPEDDYEAEVYDDDVEPDPSVSETTVTLNVADDGSKVEAQTPDGTRIATPNLAKDPPAPQPSSSSAKASYAAALKAKPNDWHLEFSMDDQILPLDLTIYGAVYQHEARKPSGPPLNPNTIWSGIYTVKFKKVPGPPPLSEGDGLSRDRSSSPMLSSVPLDAPHAKILRLLRVFHKLNAQGSDRLGRNLVESAFVNNKLTAKLTRQLEEPMIVASSCLPEWALDLPQHFPFLFPFATRYSFLQSTSFGYARLILKWQSQQARTPDSSRRDDAFGFLGRLQRQKVRISRKHILESAIKVFELYGSSSSVLEVEYFEEVGTGLGPTLEFYSLVSKEFARRDLKIWRDSDSTIPGPYVHHPQGLFPAPLGLSDMTQDRGQKRTHLFQVIGQFVAKALLDSRIIDMSLNKIFLKLVLEEEVPQTITSLRAVDPDLANSLLKLQTYVETRRAMESDASMSPHPKKQFARSPCSAQLNIEDLALDFTVPGYDIELKPGGRDISVTAENVDEYIATVVDTIIGKGALAQAKAFREGFSKVFPVGDLKIFSSEELIMMFGNADEDWSMETLSEALKADHGFNVESRAIRDLVELMSEYDVSARREYLQFITGSPKLPIGGFRGLNPPLTVVRKPHEAPLSADDYLPSVMTCVNYLKLPEYSSKVVMAEKLETAMKEGVGSFHLS